MSGARQDEREQTSLEPAWLEALRRGSGLALDSEGRWRFGTGFVENERVQELFHRGLERRADGEIVLRVGAMWCYVKSDGPILFVRRFNWEHGTAELLGGRAAPLSGAIAGWGPDSRLYLWFEGVEGPAACLRTAHQDATARLSDDEKGVAIALKHGERCVVVMLSQAPGAGSPRPVT